jgi:hypothetical protein
MLLVKKQSLNKTDIYETALYIDDIIFRVLLGH